MDGQPDRWKPDCIAPVHRCAGGPLLRSQGSWLDHGVSAVGFGLLYWGGASYFYKADQQLSVANKMSTVDVLKECQKCCHQFDMSLGDVIKSFDEISETTILSELEVNYKNLPAREILSEIE